MIINEYGLTLVVVGAKDLKNVSTLGKLDTFVQITYGNEVYRTSVLKDSGCSPVWNYEVCLTGKSSLLRIDVFDDQLFKPKLIGSITINIAEIKEGDHNFAFYLYNKHYGKDSTGIVFTKISLFSLVRNSLPHPCHSYPPIATHQILEYSYYVSNRASPYTMSPRAVTKVPEPILQRSISLGRHCGLSVI